MKLFNRFIKKDEVKWPVIISACADGKIIPMENIPDEVFSAGVLGTCCGIEPENGVIYSPVNGKIVQLADSLHAIGIEGEGNLEILIHVGIDTVDMNGDGFKSLVKVGETVSKGDKILEVSLEKIREAGHPTVVITIVTNTNDFGNVELSAMNQVKHGENLFLVSK